MQEARHQRRLNTADLKLFGTTLFTWRSIPAWIVLLVGILLTALLSMGLAEQRTRSADLQFELHVKELMADIENRLLDHEQILLGGAGLFDVSGMVSRTQWRSYVERLSLKDRYPGIQGVGFSQAVPAAALDRHIAEVRDEGFPEYTVRPEGRRELYTSIIYLEPFMGRNLAAFGFDMFSEPVRRHAMQQAVNSNSTTISGKVTLVQETHGKAQAGFLMYLPIYRHAMPISSAQERWQALLGFVYSPYRMNDLMQGILGGRDLVVDFTLYDGESIGVDALMYDSAADRAQDYAALPSHQSVQKIDAFGQNWTLLIQSRPAFQTQFASSIDWLIPSFGIGISLLLFALILSLLGRREQALALANEMSARRLETEVRFRQFFGVTDVLAAASEVAIIATDRDGLITIFNKGAERLLGYSANEMVGKLTPAVFHEPKEVIARGAELSMEFGRQIEGFRVFVEIPERDGAEKRDWIYLHKNGQVIHVSLVVTSMLDDVGEIIGYLGIAEDISERKQTLRALQDERDLFSNGPVFTIIWEASEYWPVSYVSDNISEILGYTPAEMQAPEFHYAELIHPDDIERIASEVKHHIEQHIDIYEQSYRLRLKDGSYRWFYDFSKLVRDSLNRVVTIRGYMFDQSHIKQIEMELNEQSEHIQSILNNMIDGIVTIDQKGIIESFNPAAERIFGYSVDEVLGQNIKILMPNPYRDAHDSFLRNYQATGVARIIGIGREVEGQRKDGSLFLMDLAISEVSRHGKPIYVGMVRDITERKRMERMKSEFVSTVSHELRTPLTSITGALGLIMGGALGDLPEQAQQMLGIAHKNSQRLTHLINDLLDMEKIAAGKLHFEMQVQPLMPLIEQALEANRAYGADRCVNLVLTGQATNALVWVDAQRLMQVLANLLSNAIKFSPEGAVVKVSVETRENKALISVADNGPGIPDSFRESIFQKFSQADASDIRQKGGTGLGLAITRELVERMSGTIDFDSVEGDGATFWFELPLAPALEYAMPSDVMNSLDHDAPHILVVEDEPDIAQLLAMMLARAGYRIDIATNGAEALEALQHDNYDLVSLDLMLPGISGLEVIRQMRQNPQTADLPIVVVSAKMEEGRLAINGDFSGIDWLSKPVHQNHLLSVVERQLALSIESEPRVLHVEDDADLHQVICTMVGKRFDFELATTLEDARARLMLERFDVVILDLGLPDGSGWDLLPIIRTQQPKARVIILSGTEMTTDEAHKVEAVLLKSKVSPRELLDAIGVRIQSFKSKGKPA